MRIADFTLVSVAALLLAFPACVIAGDDKAKAEKPAEKSAAAKTLIAASKTKKKQEVAEDNGNGYDEFSRIDHIEGFNRAVFAFNETVDDFFMKPVARGYRKAVPEYGRKRVSSFFTNLSSPVVFVNDVVQGDVDAAFSTFWRFVLNTTLGIGGLFDFAGDAGGLKHRPEDFGQSLAKHGVGNGTYLVLPLLGPSSARDAFGRVVDILADPTSYANDYITYGLAAGGAINSRESLLDPIDDIYDTSFDPYATMRSAYIQHRSALISNDKSNFGDKR